MKKWMNAELETISLDVTKNEPTNQMACDDYQDGIFLLGIRSDVSGPSEYIGYTPGEN